MVTKDRLRTCRVTVALAIAVVAVLASSPARANSGHSSRRNFHQLLAYRPAPAAYWRSPIPPPIPPRLLVQPRPPAQQQHIEARRAQILSIYYRRSLSRNGLAGGVIFGPDGSPITPVLPVNIFTYFPVFRVF